MHRNTVNLLLQEQGFLINLKKLVVTLIARHGFSWYGNKLQRNDHLYSRRETPKSEITMLRFVSESTSVNFTTDEGVRASHVNNPDFPSATTEQSFPPATADSNLERKQVLSGKYNSEQQLETRASIVDTKLEDFQRDFSSQTGSTSCAPRMRMLY